MDDLDTTLSRMKALPIDPRLTTIDDAVLAGLARQLRSHVSMRAMIVMTALSLGIGLVGAAVPSAPAGAASVFPLGAPAMLAPSTLLGSGQ